MRCKICNNKLFGDQSCIACYIYELCKFDYETVLNKPINEPTSYCMLQHDNIWICKHSVRESTLNPNAKIFIPKKYSKALIQKQSSLYMFYSTF